MIERKIWLVTGASSGLGRAIAESAINSGHFVIASFRNKEEIETFNQENAGNGKGVFIDLQKKESIQNAVATIIDEFGRMDVLVNNAGLGFAGSVEEASMEEIRSIFEANVFGTMQLTKEILPLMRRQRKGRIIQISSHAGIKAFAGFGIYNASKFALEGWSEALADEVSPLGINVSIVEPGPFRTNFAGRNLMMAINKIDDYRITAGAFSKKLKSVHGKQEGDPEKAGAYIVDYVDSGKKQLRLMLGKTPLTTVQMKIDSLQNDLIASKTAAEEVVFSEAIKCLRKKSQQ